MQQIKEFLDTVSIYGKKSTVKNYGYFLELFADFTHKPIEEITPGDVSKWVQTLEIKYAPTTVSLAVSVVKEYLHDYAPQINTRRIRTRKAHSQNPSQVITPVEYVAMLSHIKAKTRLGIQENLLIRLLYDTGARVGEIHQFLCNPVYQDCYGLVGTEKTSEKRYIAWGRDTNVFLNLWVTFNKNPPSIRQIERAVKKYAEMAQISKKITPHSFRHTKAHQILDNGGTIKDISEVLGHKSPLSSFHYLRENEQEKITRQNRWIT